MGTAVQVRTGKVFTGRVRSGWAVHDGKGFNRSGGVESGTARQGSLGRVRAGLFRCDAERYVVVRQSWMGSVWMFWVR